MQFSELFRRASGQSAYPYQEALATTDLLPEVLVAPTGAGKTAAIVLAWLYRRRFAAAAVRRNTPRRLVFCLPMRTLVTQTYDATLGWLAALGLRGGSADADPVSVHMLMGGVEDEEWLRHPERDAVLIGTQDMLLSRALNRGYGASRFAWPWHFALVSNDCWWAFDEVQLMGVGLATGLQLAALRNQLGTWGPTHALFMSATLDPAGLTTVDHPRPHDVLTLSNADLKTPTLARRRTAAKRLSKARATIKKDFAKELGREVLARHQGGTRTLVVLNTVSRALALANTLERATNGRVPIVLLHSRFRPPDRDAALTRALAPSFDGIVVSTQVIEAGVDISARTLVTELAPWPSLVQRAGRCNRSGEYGTADVVWVDHVDPEDTAAPYDPAQLASAREHLVGLTSFNPAAIERAHVRVRMAAPSQVVRRRDVIDLFDTTPDLAGLDIDVSPFVREGEERDVQVFWRAVGHGPSVTEPAPTRDELCSVPFYELRGWVRENPVWRWNHLNGAWEYVRSTDIWPGGVFLVDSAAGGYCATRGWDSSSRDPVPAPSAVRGPSPTRLPESVTDDPLAVEPTWVPLESHSQAVRAAAGALVQRLAFSDLPAGAIVHAAHLHDVGKAHPVFQETMRRHHPNPDDPTLWAKSAVGGHHSRPGFRHELGGALAWLTCGGEAECDLIAYLIAAHHGKVRLSIRSLPNEIAPPEAGQLFARGIWDGDVLPAVDLGDGIVVPGTVLDLTLMRLGRTDGRPSWAERMIGLRDRWGPFRLAYLEALVRVADVRVSREAG